MEGRMELNSFKIYVGLWIYVGPGRTNTRGGVGTRHGTITPDLRLTGISVPWESTTHITKGLVTLTGIGNERTEINKGQCRREMAGNIYHYGDASTASC